MHSCDTIVELGYEPKTVVVVTVLRVVVVAIRYARVVGCVVPRTAPQHPISTLH